VLYTAAPAPVLSCDGLHAPRTGGPHEDDADACADDNDDDDDKTVEDGDAGVVASSPRLSLFPLPAPAPCTSLVLANKSSL
jgi:hypothetical protein